MYNMYIINKNLIKKNITQFIRCFVAGGFAIHLNNFSKPIKFTK